MRTALLAVVLFAACVSEPVGFYDPQRVFDEVEAKTALPEIAEKMKPARDALATAEGEAAKANETNVAEKKAAAAAAKEKLEQLDKDVRAEVLAKFNERVGVAIAKIATAHRMTLVLSIVGKPMYGSPKADLTGEIISALGGELALARAAERTARERREKLEAADAGRKRVP